jgi:hypothetical protein
MVTYCLYVDVDYDDGGHSWGMEARFTSDSTGWHHRTVTIADRVGRARVTALSVYAMVRGAGFGAWFSDVEVRMAYQQAAAAVGVSRRGRPPSNSSAASRSRV